LVLVFLHFDNAGITQADAVRENSADVDIEPGLCLAGMGGTPTAEPFTQTIVNAVFRNEEASDIRLEGYTVDFGPDSGLPNSLKVFRGAISDTVEGGRCSTAADRQCAVDADCLSTATGGGGTCFHSETTIRSLLVVDFDVKAQILPGTYNVFIEFFGSDPNRSFQTTASYVMRFDNFDNCKTTTGGAGV